MCIRDRDDTVYDIRTGQVTLAKNSTMKGASATFGGDSTLLLSDGSVPVSYTHLDVYKRQPL